MCCLRSKGSKASPTLRVSVPRRIARSAATGGSSVPKRGGHTCADGIVDVANDVLGVLEKFANLGGAPSKPQADLEPAMPDQIINITDVMHALGAFGGQEYDFSVPQPCP